MAGRGLAQIGLLPAPLATGWDRYEADIALVRVAASTDGQRHRNSPSIVMRALDIGLSCQCSVGVSDEASRGEARGALPSSGPGQSRAALYAVTWWIKNTGKQSSPWSQTSECLIDTYGKSNMFF